jgi:hypothetical protein
MECDRVAELGSPPGPCRPRASLFYKTQTESRELRILGSGTFVSLLATEITIAISTAHRESSDTLKDF